MASNFTVLYDACVLYPAPLRDFLMQLATTELFRAKWTDKIHDEWIRNVLKNRPDLTLEQLTRTKNLMNAKVDDSLVVDFEYLIPTLELPDPDDRHVLAAAIESNASVIVTFNLKDFPNSILERYELEAQHPDDFIVNIIDLAPQIAIESAEICRNRLKNPPRSVGEYIATLLQQGLPQSIELLKEFGYSADSIGDDSALK